jgi:hypothetical protein
MNGIRNLFKELLRNTDNLMLREEILAVLDSASAQVTAAIITGYTRRLLVKCKGCQSR